MTTYIHNPGNQRPIDELYAFMTIDEHGRHGIAASILPGLGSTPLVTGSAIAVQMMKPLAQQLANQTGMKIGLFRFKRDAQLWETTP